MKYKAESIISDVAQLRELYGEPMERALVKELDYLSDHYRRFVEAAPFLVLASVGPEGLDASPRGDAPGFVRVADAHTLMLPDRRGGRRAVCHFCGARQGAALCVGDPHRACLFSMSKSPGPQPLVAGR